MLHSLESLQIFNMAVRGMSLSIGMNKSSTPTKSLAEKIR